MNRFAVFVAAAALAMGIGGAAQAQDVPVPDQKADAAGAQESATDVAKTAGCPVAGQAADGKDQKYEEACAGYPQSVSSADSPADGVADVTKYLCTVGDAVKKGFADNGVKEGAGAVQTAQDKGGCKATSENPGGSSSDCSCVGRTPTGGGGSAPSAEVQARNAGADGSLPRTGGGEALMGLGAGLMSLSGLIRRRVLR